MSISEKLLLIEPQELTFCFELMKNASCGIRLCSNSSRHVAFKFECFAVIMRAPEEVPPNMECKDKFLIKSVLASPDDTVARTQKLFNNRAHAVGDYKLRVVYVLPQQQQRSGGGSSINGQILKKRSSNSTKLGWLGDNLYMKAISVLFLSLIFLYLIMRILPVIWSWMFVVTFFVIKMAKRLVSDSVEDWVVKTLVYICLHFFTVVFQRKRSRSGLETQVPVG
ncbi:vesicle-associated protein 2-1-like isoform X2 [Salvia hispanica]|uniref:vesicle-associated protein 2-1-like isoform X2 n=1 Tax=Salvia hispanica TaxID=49212 RepID=UPI002009AB4F|nr:vesicle-associated protein 2-1-like isoform X2 [Salvia hispanica]